MQALVDIGCSRGFWTVCHVRRWARPSIVHSGDRGLIRAVEMLSWLWIVGCVNRQRKLRLRVSIELLSVSCHLDGVARSCGVEVAHLNLIIQ